MRPLQHIIPVIVCLALAGCSQSVPPQPFSPSYSKIRTLPPPQVSVTASSQAVPVKSITTDTPMAIDEPAPGSYTTPSLSQLTSGGCCVQPFWSPDGERVLFIDRPSSEVLSGIWGVDLLGNPPQFVTDKIGIFSPTMEKRAIFQNGATVVEDLATGDRWRIPNRGQAVSFSPDGNWLAWTTGQAGPPYDRVRREVWVSLYDGTQARKVFAELGGSFGGWFTDGRMLVSSRLVEPEILQVYWVLSLNADEQVERVELGRGGRLREPSISPDGRYMVYLSSFNPDPGQDGLWLFDTRNNEQRRLEVFGAFQWRNGTRLLVIPLDYGQPSHRLLQVDASSGAVQDLTDPAVTSFKISAGDWAVSPDGNKIVFVSADDGNLWLLSLLE